MEHIIGNIRWKGVGDFINISNFSSSISVVGVETAVV